MKSKFTVKNQEYEVALEKKERGEEDKFNPYRATVTGQPNGPVQGTCQITDAALARSDEKAAAAGGASAGALLAGACGKSIASELVIRKLKPDFSLVVDYRWL